MKKRFNPKNPLDVEQSKAYYEYLIKKGKPFTMGTCPVARNLSQNALFHTWVAVLAQQLGYSDLKEFKVIVKDNLLGTNEYINPLSGKISQREYHTSEMSEAEMSAFMDKFKVWAMADFGCYLPYFGDAGYTEMINEYSNKQ